jgi:hypothetical protein
MTRSQKLAHLLSEFTLDIAKAYFIGTFVTASLTNVAYNFQTLLLLIQGVGNAIVYLLISWYLAELEEQL